jgi:hypothetical protein
MRRRPPVTLIQIKPMSDAGHIGLIDQMRPVEAPVYAIATQSISMSNGPVHSGTQTKMRAGGCSGK